MCSEQNQRYAQSELGTLLRFGFHEYVSAKCIGQLSANSQSQTYAFLIEVSILHDLSKGLKQLLNLRGRHPYPRIFYSDHKFLLILIHGDDYPYIALFSILYGI